MKENRFVHLSDLHFTKPTQDRNPNRPNHNEIKCRILDYISNLISEEQIGAILISGDLGNHSSELLLPYLNDWTDKGSKVFIVFGEHDSITFRKEFIHQIRDNPSVFIFENYGVIDEPNLSFMVTGMSCSSKQKGFRDEFLQLRKTTGNKPKVFLTHPSDLASNKIKELNYRYYATGHIHKQKICEIDNNIYFGRPGHLYSYWDGDGKAWSTGCIIGEFIDGHLNLSWREFPIENTIRLFVDPFDRKDGKYLLVIENCSKERKNCLSEILQGDWRDEGYRGIYHAYVDINADRFRNQIREILEIFSGEIFVTPSDSSVMKEKYGYSRAVFYAKTLLDNKKSFDEFLDRIIKATPKTQ